MNNNISISIVTYNSLSKTKMCLESVSMLLKREDILELLIWDNDSDDSMKDYLVEFSKNNNKTRIIFSNENIGCSGGREKLFNLTQGNKILSLDSDVVVTRDSFLDKLINAEEDTQTGLVGCAGAMIDYNNIEFALVDENYSGPIDAIIGYCQFFSKNIISNGVNYDNYYYPNGEDDIDFSMQIKKNLNLECYKLPQLDFGLIHEYSHTNRNNFDKRNKNFKHIFKKFQIYDKNPYGRIKFTIKASVLIKKIKRCLGKINLTNSSSSH